MNLYAYAGNNPVAFTDPLGLAPCPPDDDCGTLVAAFTLAGAAIGATLGGGLGLGCGPGALACSYAGAAAFSAEGAMAGAAAGATVAALFARNQADAVAKAESLIDHIQGHIQKLQGDPKSPAANGWRTELRTALRNVEKEIRHMGKRTSAKWRGLVEEWRRAIPPE